MIKCRGKKAWLYVTGSNGTAAFDKTDGEKYGDDGENIRDLMLNAERQKDVRYELDSGGGAP